MKYEVMLTHKEVGNSYTIIVEALSNDDAEIQSLVSLYNKDLWEKYEIEAHEMRVLP